MIVTSKHTAAQAAPAAQQPASPFEHAMSVWTRWIALKDNQVSQGWGHPQDTKDFMRAGEAIDVMINDLPRVEWWAVRRARGVATVWRFPDLSLPDAIARAEHMLTPKLRNHIATRRFFH